MVYRFGKFHLDRASGVNVWSVPHGYLPVDLSGFVTGYVYKGTFVSQPLANDRSFLIKRVARLYPAYLAIAALYVLKIALGLTGEETFARFNAFDANIGNLLMPGGLGATYLSAHRPVVGIKLPNWDLTWHCPS